MPDQAHAQYYKENPNGNHDTPSTQTLEFMSKMTEFMTRIDTRLSQINGQLNKHNEWIARYDIRVAEEIPKIALVANVASEQTKSIKTWVTGVGVGMTVIIVALGLFITR